MPDTLRPSFFGETVPSKTLETGSAPVGMFPDSTYEEGAVQLDPGDVVITYTDEVIKPIRHGVGSSAPVESDSRLGATGD